MHPRATPPATTRRTTMAPNDASPYAMSSKSATWKSRLSAASWASGPAAAHAGPIAAPYAAVSCATAAMRSPPHSVKYVCSRAAVTRGPIGPVGGNGSSGALAARLAPRLPTAPPDMGACVVVVFWGL